MKTLLAVTAAMSALGLATAALAAPPLTATLAAPVAKEKVVVAGGAAWRCVENTCRVASDNGVTPSAACRELFRQVGEIAQIGYPDRPLDAERLAKCNRK